MPDRNPSELKVYGIFGNPLAHTVSPAIQNRAFDFYHLRSIYFAFERSPERFRYLMRRIHSLALSGFNVTVPFKRAVCGYLDRLSPQARAVKAVNTVNKEKGRWVGYNTDVDGFLISLRKEGKFNPRGKKILVFGAGGSARAVSYSLGKSGAREICLVNRPRFAFRREEIISDFSPLFKKTIFRGCSLTTRNLKNELKTADLIVNATSVGVKFQTKRLIPENLIPKAKKGRRLLFFDLVYHKPTIFLKSAKKKGHKILDGKGMLLYQGAKAFEIWTGKGAPISRMKKALHDALHSQ